MYKLSLYEQETIVNFNAEEKTMEIYTAEPKMIRKLDKLCKEHPDFYSLKKEDEVSKTYICSDKSLLTFRSFKIKKELTDEQKEELKNKAIKNFKHHK